MAASKLCSHSRLFFVVMAFLCFPVAQARYGEGGWIMGGLGAGGLMVQSSRPSDVNPGQQETDKVGYSGHIRSGLAWYPSSWFVVDAAGGFHYSDVYGKEPASGTNSVSIQHQTATVQISPRLRFGELGMWQLGPFYRIHLGTDTSFREKTLQSTGQAPRTHYAGAHFNYDIPSETEKTLYRFGVEVLSNVSGKRRVLAANLLFEIGFSLWGDSSSYESPNPNSVKPVVEQPPPIVEDLPPPIPEEIPPIEEPETAPEPKIEGDPNAITARSVGNLVTIRFPGDRFQFATGMSHIGSTAVRTYLREFGEFMARNDALWEKAKIVGHTDRRGPKGRARAVNLELSKARAQTVYNTLKAAGMNPAKMRYEGKAFDEPVPGAPDNPAGWKMNRRVEVSFDGVREPDKILGKIEELNKRYE